MSENFKKMLVVSAMYISTAMLIPQQISATTLQAGYAQQSEENLPQTLLQEPSESQQETVYKNPSGELPDTQPSPKTDGEEILLHRAEISAKTLPDDAKEWSGSVQAKEHTILPAPETVQASKIAYHAITLTWSAVEGAAGYQIEYATDGKDYKIAGTTKADIITYKCKGLLTGTEYVFRVCALDEEGKAGNYTSVQAVPSLKKTKITSIFVEKLRAITLEWKKVAGATRYQIYRKTAEQDSYEQIAVTAELTYTDETVLSGASYSYRVQAIRDVEDQTIQAPLSAAAEASVVLPTLQFETWEAVNHHSVKLTWQQVDTASGYYLYRSGKEDGTYRKIKTINKAETTSYTDSKIVPGKKFYYKICMYVQTADKTVTLGEQSDAVQVLTQMDAPQLVSVTPNVKNRSLELEWKKVEGATGYRIYRSLYPDQGFKKIEDKVSGSYVGHEDRGVTPGGTYYYRIKAISSNGAYKGLSAASATLEGTAAPSAPIGLTIEQTSTDILMLNWQKSNGAQSYNLYRSEDGGTNYICISEGITDNTYEDYDLEEDHTYLYRVSAVGIAGEGTKCLPVSYTIGGVSMNTRTLKLCVGVSKQLEVSTFRQGKVVWKSEDPQIAEVNSDGIVTGISYGTVNITATVSGKSASTIVSVTPGSKNGIDVSKWQEDVDWYRVKNSGVEFAFLRISNHYLEDYTFETKYVNATSVGMPLGVYCYSRAASIEEAKQEALTVLNILDGRELAYPIALDMEDAIHKSKSMTKETLHGMIQAFKQVIEEAGYQFVLYSYVTFLNSNLDRTQLDGIDLWVARYRNVSLGTGYTGTGNQKYWQYNSGQYSGSNFQVDGITNEAGDLVAVDVNIEY